MDFIEGLPTSQAYTVIMEVADRLSKYAHFVPLKHLFIALIVVKAFLSCIIKLHEVPRSITSNRDKVFVSVFWKALFQMLGTSLCISSIYHSQTDRHSKVVNLTLEQYFHWFAHDQLKKLLDWLAWVESSYNTTVHPTTGLTYFEAICGIPPPNLLLHVPRTIKVQAVDEFLQAQEKVLKTFRHHLVMPRNCMKVQAN